MLTTSCPDTPPRRAKRSALTRRVLFMARCTPVGRGLRKLVGHVQGATMLETVLLLAAIAIPSYVIIDLSLKALLGIYQMMTTLINLPFP